MIMKWGICIIVNMNRHGTCYNIVSFSTKFFHAPYASERALMRILIEASIVCKMFCSVKEDGRVLLEPRVVTV